MAQVGKGSTHAVHPPEVPDEERFRRLEYANGDDFPYYRGWPRTVTGAQWAIVLVAWAVGFLVLGWGLDRASGNWLPFIPRALFVAIPLGALAWVASGFWTALFRRVGLKDVLWMFGFGIINIVVTMGVGAITMRYFQTSANAAGTAVVGKDAVGLFAFYAGTGVQLFGEELLTILPFLAIMSLCTAFGLSRKASVLWAWGISAIVFGLLHLPTYNWNLMQCLIGISVARLVLSLAYMKTKNIWVSTGAHIFNDWFLFTLPLMASALTAATK